MFSLYLVRRGGGIYVAYITSWPGLDATFIQLMGGKKKRNLNYVYDADYGVAKTNTKD